MADKLYRSRADRVIAGVAGGLGEHLGVDAVLIRLAWAAMFFLGGSGLLLYILAWVIIPEEPEWQHLGDDTSLPALPEGDSGGEEDAMRRPSSRSQTSTSATAEQRRKLTGGILIILGLVFFGEELMPHWVNTDLIWPVALIGLGIFLLSRRTERGGR